MASYMRNWTRNAKRLGLAVEPTRGGHQHVIDPDTGRVLLTIARTPSDHRALKNATAQLRRAGFDMRTMRRVPVAA